MKKPLEGVPPPETTETKAELKEDWTMGQRFAPAAFELLADEGAGDHRNMPDLRESYVIAMFMP